MLELRALGNAEIETDKTILRPSQEIVFASALYLILEQKKRISRTALAELLWPRVEERTRGHRMRQTLLQLKKLGVPVIADRNEIHLDPDAVRADFGNLDSLDERALSHRESLEFLPGYSPRFSEPFRDWVDSRRSELHSLCTRAMLSVLRDKRVKGDWNEVERIARRALLLDPYNESAVLALAEASAMRGQKREAVSILDDYLREVGSVNPDLKLPATLLRKRIADAVPAKPTQVLADSVFVGREKEMQQLTAYLQSARQARGDACLIHGEPGIGKTRLGLELGNFARLQGVKFQRVGCRRSDIDRPLSVFVDLVPQLRELPGALGCSQETLVALKRLTEFDGSNTEAVLTFEELTSLYFSMRRALLDLLDAIAEEQCLLILVEDVQWLDRTSAKLFAEMVEWSRTRKLLFLFNARPGANPFLDNISAQGPRAIELLPLEPVHAEELLQVIVSDRPSTPHANLQWLLSVGEGNPFFLQELGKHWVETGHQHDAPPSVATVLNTRLSRISREGLQVLQVCAVLGEHATIDRVESVIQYNPHQLLSAIQELSVAGMLISSGREVVEVGEQLQVRHDLISTAAVAQLAPISLAYLHRRAGSILEQAIAAGRNPTSLLWAAAYHWGNAGDNDKALAVAQFCAEHLLEVGLPTDASAAFEKAFEYCKTDESKLNVLSRLVLALQMDCHWERSKEILLQCRGLRHRLAPDANLHDELELRLFDARWRASLENSTLLQDLQDCVGSREASAGHRVACGLLALKVASDLGAVDQMRPIYEHIEPLLTTAEVANVTRFEVTMVFHSVCGDPKMALDNLDDFLDTVRGEKNALLVSRALCNAAFACRLAGRQKEAIALFSESMEHSIKHGLLNRAGTAASGLVRLFFAAGQVERAREALEKAEALYRTGGDVHTTADQFLLSARLAFEEGNIERAEALYRVLEASLTPQQTVNRRSHVLALGIVIGIRASSPLGRLEKLVNELHAMHLITRATGCQDFEAHALYVGLCAVGKSALGSQLIREYAHNFRHDGSPLPKVISDVIEAVAGRNQLQLAR